MKKYFILLFLICKLNSVDNESHTLILKISPNSETNIHFIHISAEDPKHGKYELHKGARSLKSGDEWKLDVPKYAVEHGIYITSIQAKKSEYHNRHPEEINSKHFYVYDVGDTVANGIKIDLHGISALSTTYEICVNHPEKNNCEVNDSTQSVVLKNHDKNHPIKTLDFHITCVENCPGKHIN